MFSKRSALFPLGMIGAVWLGLSCSKKDVEVSPEAIVVARVVDRPITKSYFEDRLAKMERRFVPDTLDLAGKRKFLDFILNKEVMALKAEELAYDTDPNISNYLSRSEEILVHTAAVDHVCEGKLEATEEEIDEFHEKKKTQVWARHILVDTRRQAERLYEAIQKGASFDSLADVHSVVPRRTHTGESISLADRTRFGAVEYGKAMVPVEEAVFETEVDQVTRPVWSAAGWHLFLPVSRSTVRLSPPTEGQRRATATQISLRKKRSLVYEYYDDILKDHGFKLHEDALTTAYRKFPQNITDLSQIPDRSTEVKPVIPYTQEERDQVLFELDGKKYTIGDFSNQYDEKPYLERPRQGVGTLGVSHWIRDVWLRPLQLERARKDGFAESPEIVNELKQRREQAMVSKLYADFIQSQAPSPTLEELEAFFAEHKALYVQNEQRVCNLISNRSENVVRRAYAEVLEGAGFIDTAIRYTPDAEKPEDIQTVPFAERTEELRELAEKAFSLAKGEYTEPFETSEGWVVAQVEQIIPPTQLEFADPRLDIAQDFKNSWSENKLNEYLEQWKANMEIQVYDDVLATTEVRRDDVFVPAPQTTAANPKEAS